MYTIQDGDVMSHGGQRENAGRPKGRNIYGESTKPIRIPISRIDDIKAFLKNGNQMQLPLYSNSVSAGFPSPEIGRAHV